jgi:hypothetical protein
MFDFDQFEERSAIMEFDGGMTRFEAETVAAKAQGLQRWEALRHADSKRNPAPERDHRPAPAGQPANDLPGVQRGPEEQTRPVSERRVQV